MPVLGKSEKNLLENVDSHITLSPNGEWLAYVGRDDPWFAVNAREVLERAWAKGKPFEVIEVEGDHMASLPPSLAAFLELARRDVPRVN